MANLTDNPMIEDAWVNERIASLRNEPNWEPNARRGLDRLRTQIANRGERQSIRRKRMSRLAVAFVILILVLPVTLVIAQRLMASQSLFRVEPLRMNLDTSSNQLDLPADASSFRFTRPPMPLRPAAYQAASQAIGFSPVFPVNKLNLMQMFRIIGDYPIHGSLLIQSAPPYWSKPPYRSRANMVLMVSAPIAVEVTIEAAALRSALHSAGADDVVIPQSWNGAVIGASIAASAIANYDGVLFAQSKPLSIEAPPQVSLPQYFNAQLRVNGLSASEASRLRDKFVASPAAFVMIPPKSQVEVEEVPLWQGSGTLFKNIDGKVHSCSFCPGPSEVLFVWNNSERVYALKGKLTRDQAIAFSYSLQ